MHTIRVSGQGGNAEIKKSKAAPARVCRDHQITRGNRRRLRAIAEEGALKRSITPSAGGDLTYPHCAPPFWLENLNTQALIGRYSNTLWHKVNEILPFDGRRPSLSPGNGMLTEPR